MQRVAPVQLALRTKRHLGLLFEDPEFEQTLGEYLHRRLVRCLERRTGLHHVDAGLLSGQHEFVDSSLRRRVGATNGHRSRDVGGVEVVALDARIEQQEIALAHGTGVPRPVQDRRVRTAGRDGVVAGVVTFDARAHVEDTFDDAFAATFGGGQRPHDVFESLDGVVNGQLELRDLEVVLHQTMFTQRRGQDLVVLVRLEVVIELLVESPHADDLGRRQGVESGLERFEWQRVDVVVRRRLVDASSSADPQLAVAAVGEELVRTLIAPVGDVQRGTRSGSARRDDEYRVGLVTSGQVEEVRAGAESVVRVVRANLVVAGRHDDRSPGELLGDACSPRRAERGGGVYVGTRRDGRPVLGHVFHEAAWHRRSVIASPDPVLGDGILFGNVRFGNGGSVLGHDINLQPVVRNRLPPWTSL